MRGRRVVAALVLVLGTATWTSADPLVVRSGYYELVSGEGGEWVLQGEGFNFRGEGIAQEIAFWDCLLCAPGTPLSLDARLTFDSPFEAHAAADVNGTSYASVFWQGDFTFSSGTVAAQFGATETLPFTFAGWLNGYLTPYFTGTPFFSGAFTGSGTAQVRFFRQNVSPNGIEVASVSYQFSDTDPVPEPGTLALLGTGLAGLVAARRQRR